MPHADAALVTIRDYRESDADGWVTCRVLSFVQTQYYDDVKPSRTRLPDGAIELVAVADGGRIVGILDIEVDGAEATIDSVAVRPGWQHAGVATRLLSHALVVLEGRGVRTLDAWTREDAAANRWYQRNGFAETTRYLHVYLGDGDDPSDFTTPDGLSSPVTVFVHGRTEDEADLRARYRRVYVCRRYARDLTVR